MELALGGLVTTGATLSTFLLAQQKIEDDFSGRVYLKEKGIKVLPHPRPLNHCREIIINIIKDFYKSLFGDHPPPHPIHFYLI